jgi:hypothetical protein
MSCARFFRREGFSLIAIAFVASAVTSMCSAPAVAHDQWADGSPIPAWVSKYCCGVADAHRLTVKQIYRVEGGWRAEGYAHMIPEDRVLPSEMYSAVSKEPRTIIALKLTMMRSRR